MKYEFVVLVLWAIAIFATLMIVDDPRAFTSLGPVYLICMVGTILTMRKARRSR